MDWRVVKTKAEYNRALERSRDKDPWGVVLQLVCRGYQYGIVLRISSTQSIIEQFTNDYFKR
jgi:hypothetical protein